jgi:hypothetical protein
MRLRYFPLAILACGLSAALFAAPKANRQQQRPEALEAVLRCRAITDEKARLACFDSAVAGFETALASREVVAVDRQQIRQQKRSLFGLDLPNLNPFGGGGDNDDGTEVNSLDGVVASAFQDSEGRWVMTLQEGGTWRQISDAMLGRNPRRGSKVHIRKAAMGSYMLRVDGQPGFRARRER